MVPSPEAESQVAIVGAGPVGAALAFVLASRGVDVVLLERQSDFDREFRGEVVLPSGLAVLDDVGLGEAVARLPQAVPDAFELYRDRRRVFRLELDRAILGSAAPRSISQPALLEMIVEQAHRSPSFRFERGATVRDLLRENGRVTGVVADTDAGRRELRAKLVIGCDGRASVVRRRGGFQRHGDPLIMDVVWCKLPPLPRPEDQGTARFQIGRGHLQIAFPAPDGRLQVAWVILKGTFGELRSRGVEGWIDEMADFAEPTLGAHLRAHRDHVSRPFLLDAALDRVEAWSRPGVLLLGDAAHTMSPVGAQGINIALRDAVVAANCLVPVLTGPGSAEAIDAAARRVEEERLPEVRIIQRMQSIPPRFALGPAWYHAAVRALVAGVLGTATGRRLATRTVMPFLFGTTDVRLAV